LGQSPLPQAFQNQSTPPSPNSSSGDAPCEEGERSISQPDSERVEISRLKTGLRRSTIRDLFSFCDKNFSFYDFDLLFPQKLHRPTKSSPGSLTVNSMAIALLAKIAQKTIATAHRS
jgi:hypothetical protein